MAEFETYVTVEGDTVDLIVFERFGSSVGATEAVLAANPGLADQPPILPGGLTVRLPLPGVAERSQSTRLWS